ncbi:MAG: uncharacterized protein A8A55_3049, partial [Amphiamblys sp. WSBS2006]
EITPNTTVSDIEMELLDVKRQEILRDMGRRGVHVAPEHLEETTERRRLEQSENSGTIQPRLVDSLVLTIAELSAGPVLLGPETTVYLPDMWLSDALFFRLLEKTKVVLGGTVSLFKHLGRKKCIREGMDVEYEEEVRLSPAIKNNTLFRENVAGLPDKSIYLWGVKSLTLKDHTVNLLPKLKLHEDNETEELWLDAELGEHVSSILAAKDSSIWLGRVKSLKLYQHAINLLPKLKLHEDNVLEEELSLDAELREHVSSILRAGNGTIWLGKVKRLKLNHLAVNLLPKLKLHEDNVMEEFWPVTWFGGSVSEKLHAKDSIWLGKVKNMKLEYFAINILPLLKLHEDSEMKELKLDADAEKYICSILRAKDNSIWLGKMKNIRLERLAIKILPKLRLHEDSEIEEFYLDTEFGGDVSGILGAGNRSIWLGKVKSLKLKRYAIKILPKLRLHEDNVMEKFELDAEIEEYVFSIPSAGDNSIWLGRVKSLRLEGSVINILPKLKLHEDNVMEELWLDAAGWESLVWRILGAKDNSIWLGKVRKLRLNNRAVNTLPKLKLHEDNVMEWLYLCVWGRECVSGIFGAEYSSIWLGKVKSLRLERHAV